MINYDLPNNRELYIHRIGRSGRFGRKVTDLLYSLDVVSCRLVCYNSLNMEGIYIFNNFAVIIVGCCDQLC